MPLREPMSLRATDHGVISQECTNKGRTLLFDLDMAKYIDTDKLIAEIKRLIKVNQELKSSSFTEGIAAGYGDILSAIDSLQQEQPVIEEDWVEKRKQECECRRLSANGNYQCERYEGVFGPCDGRCSWIVDYPKLKELKEMKQPAVDLEKIIEQTYHDGSVADTDDIDHVTYENIARHFYELGKNSMIWTR